MGKNGNLQSKGIIENLPITTGTKNKVAHVTVEVNSEIDKKTGIVSYSVQYSNLRFQEGTNSQLQLDIMAALKTPIPKDR